MSQSLLGEIIKENMHFLAGNTTNLTPLSNLLIQSKILTTMEVDEIDAESTSYYKCTLLYKALMKKGEKHRVKIINCLTKSGNDHIVQKIKQGANNWSGTSLIWFNIRPPTEFCTGREPELQKLDEFWRRSQKRLQFVTITGLAGVGKTELAINYAYKFHCEEKGHCIMIDAETNITAFESLRRLSSELDISVDDFEKKGNRLEIIVMKVYERVSHEKCLIILDNLESYMIDIINAFRSIANNQSPSSLKPLFLLTSRYQRVSKSLNVDVGCIQLDVLSNDSAEKFLTTTLGVNEDQPNCKKLIRRLAEQLNGHPLALHQAVCYFTDKKLYYDLEIAMEKYCDDVKKILAFPLPNSQGTSIEDISANKTIYSTLHVSLEKIKNTPTIGKDAELACNCISFISPDHIPLKLLRTVLKKMKKSDVAIPNSVFCLLSDNTLCTLRNEKISVHRLVQQTIRTFLDEKKETLNVLDGLLTSFQEIIKAREISREEMIFVEALWSHVEQNDAVLRRHPDFADDIYYLYRKCDWFRERLDFCLKSLPTLERILGERNRWTLKMKYWKADHVKGKEVFDLLKEVYTIQKEDFGDDNTNECFYTARKIGSFWEKRKRFDKALDWFEIALSHWKPLEEDKNSLIYLKVDLARCYAGENKEEEALKVLQLVLRNEKSNATETVCMRARHSLAEILQKQTKYELALKEFSILLEIQNKHLEKDHFYILRTKFNLCDVYSALGMASEALELALELHNKTRLLYGEKHHLTIKAQKIMDKIMKHTMP